MKDFREKRGSSRRVRLGADRLTPQVATVRPGTFIRNLRILVNVGFIETPTFTALIAEYLEDDEYRALQSFLTSAPEAGDVVQGTGGFRKLRWADRRRGKAKAVVSG